MLHLGRGTVTHSFLVMSDCPMPYFEDTYYKIQWRYRTFRDQCNGCHFLLLEQVRHYLYHLWGISDPHMIQ